MQSKMLDCQPMNRMDLKSKNPTQLKQRDLGETLNQTMKMYMRMRSVGLPNSKAGMKVKLENILHRFAATLIFC